MGQKVNPNSLRLGLIRNWNSNWYAKNNYSELLYQDFKLRKFLNEGLNQAEVSKISIEMQKKYAIIYLGKKCEPIT